MSSHFKHKFDTLLVIDHHNALEMTTFSGKIVCSCKFRNGFLPISKFWLVKIKIYDFIGKIILEYDGNGTRVNNILWYISNRILQQVN